MYYDLIKSCLSLNKLVACFLFVLAVVCLLIRFVNYPNISLELLLELEVLLYWLIKANKAILVLVMLFCFRNIFALLKNKSMFTTIFTINLVFDAVKALLLAFLSYAVMPAVLNINTILIYGNLFAISVSQIGEPIFLSVNELIVSYMDKKEDSPSVVPKYEEGEYVAGIRRINSQNGRFCLALKEALDAVVEASGGKETWTGWAMEKGYEIAKNTTKIPDNPCVDFPWPVKKTSK